jgi:hypothetical protein
MTEAMLAGQEGLKSGCIALGGAGMGGKCHKVQVNTPGMKSSKMPPACIWTVKQQGHESRIAKPALNIFKQIKLKYKKNTRPHETICPTVTTELEIDSISGIRQASSDYTESHES